MILLAHSSARLASGLALAAICKRDARIQIGDHEYYVYRKGEVLNPEREPLAIVRQIRSQIGGDTFAAQYQPSPVPRGVAMIKRERVLRYDQLPARTSTSKIIQSWDTASKDGELNDYSVCSTWLFHDHKHYLVDVLRERLVFGNLNTCAIGHARTHRANVILVEDTGVGSALVWALKNEQLPAEAVTPKHGKQMRMFIQAQKFDKGLVLLPTRAPWLADFEAELFDFPHSLHDDQVDSVSQALAYEPNTYDLDTLAKGTERMMSALAFQSLFRGTVM